MAVLTPASFLSKWNSRFADNSTRDISEGDMREFGEDIKDSFFSVFGGPVETAWKDPVVVATTGNITLSGEQTIDGVLTSSSRVLVRAQSTASQNGIYLSAAGAWSRSTDADAADELEGAAVGVQQGTVYANTVWLQTTDTVTLGVSSIVWQQIGYGVSLQNLDQVLAQGNDGGLQNIINISDPNDPQDAATKNYVDNAVSAISSTFTANQWVPTLTNAVNVSSSSALTCQYARIGNYVTFSGAVTITTTAGSGTSTTIELSMPIASNFANAHEAGGFGGETLNFQSGPINANTVDNRLSYSFSASVAATRTHFFSGGYWII